METSHRYLPLDVFRGLTIALMILVNTPGSWEHVYSPLRHAPWHGCTLTDLVFPFFLFAAGVSLFFSLEGQPGPKALLRIVRRVILIFALGLFLNSFPQWMTDYSHLRIMGVLQRIALAYGLAALILMSVKQRWIPAVGVFILLAYWGILYFFGGSDPYSLQGNATIPFDRLDLGESHLYRGFGIPFDPEGLLSSLPAVVTVLTGYLAGRMIGQAGGNRSVSGLALFGVVLAVAGYLWGFLLPVNKPLWTSSYVLYTGGIAAFVLAFLICVIDKKGYKKWTPVFSVFGMNSLFLFILSTLWIKTLHLLIRIPDAAGNTINGAAWLYQNIFFPVAGNMPGSFFYAISHVVLFWLIGYVLYRAGIFIKV
mgnify:CR=1 FL=1